MVELLKYTREQLVEEVQKKEASRLKLKEKLVQLKELSVNTAQVLQLNRKLEEQLSSANKKQQASTKECQSLRIDLKAAHDLTQEANTLLTEQQRNQQNLQQQVATATAQAATAERSCSQAQAAKAKSDMAFKALESELAALRKQLSHFQAGLKSVEQRQKADHQEVVQLKTQVPAPAPTQKLAPACQGCNAVQEAVLSLQKQVREMDLASAKGSTKANSAPSTQDHSGDTLDDRNHIQLRSEMQGLQDQLVSCQDQQQQFEAEMHRWRTLFGSFAALAAPGAAALQASSDMMQISPAGAEGSNVVPRHTPEVQQARGDKSRAQHRMQTGILPAAGIAAQAAHAERVTEPGIVAVARVNSTGADSDTFSAAAGTTASLMLPTHQKKALHKHPQPHPAAASAQDPLVIIASPKRKTIALQPGALQIPDGGRKRRKLAKAVQAEQGQTVQEPVHVTQQQPQPKHRMPPCQPTVLPHLAKYGAPLTDATAVDFMELQLARICNTQEPITAALVSAVAQAVCSAWQAKRCPLDCILTGIIAALLDCTAAPASTAAQSATNLSQHSQTQPVRVDTDNGTGMCQTLEEGALARLWCSEVACQQHHFTWLMHCAVELDALLSSTSSTAHNQGKDPRLRLEQAQGQPPAQAPADPRLTFQGSGGTSKTSGNAGKKRGRPPGSRNKKTLLKLQEEGKSLQDLPPAKAKRPPATGLQQHAQQLQSEQQSEQQAGQQVVPEHQQQHQQHADKQQHQALPAPLTAGTVLEGLHKQALHYLGQACQVKPPGPFDTGVCSLSAAAALFARLQGKEQALRVQVLTILRSVDLAPCIQLQSVAAAIEVWPEALVSPQPSIPSSHSMSDHGDSIMQHQGLVGMCVHAKLQDLCTQHGQQLSAGTSADLSKSCTAPGSASALDTSSSQTGRKLLLAWGQNTLTQTAAQALRHLLSKHWQQQPVQPAQQPGSAQLSREATNPLSATAAEKVLAELKYLGTIEDGNAALLDDRWLNLGLGLQLITGCLGWEWTYEQVLNKLMGPIVSALLVPAAKDSGQWAIHSLEQLLQCMVLTVQALLKTGCRNGKACTVALEALVHRLTGMAQKCMSHTAVNVLLTNSVQSMKSYIGHEGLTALKDPTAGKDAGNGLETF